MPMVIALPTSLLKMLKQVLSDSKQADNDVDSIFGCRLLCW